MTPRVRLHGQGSYERTSQTSARQSAAKFSLWVFRCKVEFESFPKPRKRGIYLLRLHSEAHTISLNVFLWGQYLLRFILSYCFCLFGFESGPTTSLLLLIQVSVHLWFWQGKKYLANKFSTNFGPIQIKWTLHEVSVLFLEFENIG